jgi:hypothetical protein
MLAAHFKLTAYFKLAMRPPAPRATRPRRRMAG